MYKIEVHQLFRMKYTVKCFALHHVVLYAFCSITHVLHFLFFSEARGASEQVRLCSSVALLRQFRKEEKERAHNYIIRRFFFYVALLL